MIPLPVKELAEMILGVSHFRIYLYKPQSSFPLYQSSYVFIRFLVVLVVCSNAPCLLRESSMLSRLNVCPKYHKFNLWMKQTNSFSLSPWYCFPLSSLSPSLPLSLSSSPSSSTRDNVF